MFNWAVERLLSNAMNTFEKGRDIKAEQTNVLEWQREEGKSSYCVEPGMMPKEERERWEGVIIKASFALHTGAPAGWLSDGELCPLACHKLAKLFTLVYAH